MTSPVTQIKVDCPGCGRRYEDWYRASLNLKLDDFDDEYVEAASTATCPECGLKVELGVLVVGRGGVWRVRD